MIAGLRISVILVGYAVAVFLALHLIFGIEFWQAALWALIITITSVIVFVVVMLFTLNNSEY